MIAPDFPGFGFSQVLERSKFTYTFNNIAIVIEEFTKTLNLNRYFIYIFDYGAPVGLRLALAQPEKVFRDCYSKWQRLRRRIE